MKTAAKRQSTLSKNVENEKKSYVWYAVYGSNLSKQRFLCYIKGGKPAYGKKTYAECRDKTPPVGDKPCKIPHRLYFALPNDTRKTKNWGPGGVAFISTEKEEDSENCTLGRMWKITREQYEKIRDEEGRAWYDEEICLGGEDGVPILTITNKKKLANILSPSGAYLNTMALGLRETHNLSDGQIAEYLAKKEGIEEKITRSDGMTLLDFLKFGDWVTNREFEDSSWIVVARSVKHGDTDMFTTSVLAKTTKPDGYKQILSKYDWETRVEFGKPTFWQRGRSKRIFFDLGNVKRINGIVFEPFIFLRDFHGIHSSQFDVVQNFLLYHNLYFVLAESVYRKIDDDGEEHDVIIIKQDGKSKEIKIATSFLRDYLVARQMVLVRQHDHRRFGHQSLGNEVKEKESKEFKYHDASAYNYAVWVRNERLLSDKESFSRLLGKDLVKPFDKPDYSELWFADEWEKKKKYCEFIIGLDKNSVAIEETCNEDELSNYFTDRKKPHFLTPVFFKREVLKKYFDNPTKYSVDARYLKCLHLWGLPIDTNKKGLVYVWLGDLGRIPYKEQQHWRQYNVPPEGGITGHRWKTDFMAEFADPDEPVFRFKEAYQQAQEHFRNTYGFEIFLELGEEDSHCYSTLHVPVNNEQKELDEQVQNLAKILNDSLNKKSLDSKADKSINSLKNFLEAKVGPDKAKELTQPLRIIQELRSSGVAHRKGQEYEKIIKQNKLDSFTNQNKFIALLEQVTKILEEISRI